MNAQIATPKDTDGNDLIVSRWYALWDDGEDWYTAMLGQWTGEYFIDEDDHIFGLHDNMQVQP